MTALAVPYTPPMVRVRGIAFIGSVQFVKDAFGSDAHDRVVAALPAGPRGTFSAPIRDAVWKPLDELVVYAGTARELLAPQDDTFYARLGFRSGTVERMQGGFLPMVADVPTAIRLAPVLWRSLYDTGRMSLRADGDCRALARVNDFPATRALCEANCGALAGLLTSETRAVRTRQLACVLDGAPSCEWEVTWDPEPAAG
jgi:hypothetical protein